ncbi:hypothetical protein [Campylobacter troglodytis]|uniref:hypothetical protein n=1 Tax=Campylobacter troglodytis TaxID=654363 RepID=UPI00115A0D0F|nr:hypothetical protein [Campylobacter troglodytis]TQR53769.1 hypothetical protein DMC01_10850 [Campylobacter troglodytis]
MAMQKDLRVLQIIQKAREFNEGDLLNEELVQSLIKSEIQALSDLEREKISSLLNSLVESKQKATLS